jgi:hypothetical protein
MYAQGFCSVGRQNCVLEKLRGNAAYGAPFSVSRTVGHLTVTSLLLQTAAFFGALSVRH